MPTVRLSTQPDRSCPKVVPGLEKDGTVGYHKDHPVFIICCIPRELVHLNFEDGKAWINHFWWSEEILSIAAKIWLDHDF